MSPVSQGLGPISHQLLLPLLLLHSLRQLDDSVLLLLHRLYPS